MKKIMIYKGFEGSVEFSEDDNVYHGIILHIRGTVTYEADTLEELPKSFEEAVDDYIETCKEYGWPLEKPLPASSR
jgi:predicted HicB family RNase H-like nuclease